MAACGFRGNKPQMNTDERRWSPVMGLLDAFSYAQFPATDFGAIHRKGRKERKAKPQSRTWMTWIGRIFTSPCASTSSVQSVFHNVCSSLKNPVSKTEVSAFICVHPRLINFKGQLQVYEKLVKLLEG
jgi:hypothetical protein